MRIRRARPTDYPRLAKWNRQLQEDEGAKVMSLEAISSRFDRWFLAQYQAVVFEIDDPVGYALFRPADPNSEGAGVYVQQFHIDRSHRRKGYGTTAFRLLASQELGEGRIILEALESNPRGHEFWVSLGFKPYSTKYEMEVNSAI